MQEYIRSTLELVEHLHGIGADIKDFHVFKCDSEGKAHRYKARLVAKGYTRKDGEDYNATFASVAKHSTFRTLLAVAAARKMKVQYYDVKTAFLNSEIEEDLFMTQPEGYVSEGEEQLVCKLRKSLYGLLQSVRV